MNEETNEPIKFYTEEDLKKAFKAGRKQYSNLTWVTTVKLWLTKYILNN